MVKSLINKLRKGILIATAGLVFQGCPLPEPVPQYPTDEPTATTTEQPTETPQPQPTPEPYRTISGRLESNEDDGELKTGEVKIYLDGSETAYDTDTDGDFSFNVPQGSNVKLRGKINEGLGSYVRTVDLGEVTEDQYINLRAVPYPDFCTPEEFRTHMNETNGTFSKWKTLDKIKVFRHNDSEGDFSDTQVDLIVSKITDENDIEKWMDGKQLDSYIEVIDGSPTQSYETNCIYVVPDNTPNGNPGVTGWTGRQRDLDRTIYAARIELFPHPDPYQINETATTHEFGHAFVASDGEAQSLDEDYTIMNPNPNGTVPKVADEKAGKIVYEDTYKPGERLDDILGVGW